MLTSRRSPKNTATKASLTPARRDILLSGLACVALIMAAFYWIQNIELPRSTSQRVAAVTSDIADKEKRVLDDLLAGIGERVTAQSSKPDIIAAFDQRDAAALSKEALDLRRSFPAATDSKLIRIGPQGIADESTETKRLRNHIEIDMLRKAIDSQQLIIEAYQHDKRWLISLLQVAGDQGAIIVSFDAEFFARILRNIAGNSVSNQLVQRYKGSESVVIAANGQQYKQYMVSRALTIPGWSLEVFPQQVTVNALTIDSTLIWLVCLLCLALITASHSIFFLRASAAPLRKALSRESTASPDIPDIDSLMGKDKTVEKKPLQSQHGGRFDPTADLRPPLPEAKPLTPKKTASKPDKPAPQSSAKEPAADAPPPNRRSCFRAYDIRGIADRDLDSDYCRHIGRALGSEALARGQQKILLGRDGRESSPRIREALIEGLLSCGVDVVDLGLIATPMLHFACHDLNIGNAVMITGSHNPAEYNGMKMLLGFESLSSEEIQALADRVAEQRYEQGEGQLSSDSIEQRYIDRICGDVVIAQTLKVVIDAGNGATSNIAVPLFEELGCEVTPLFCEVDGRFPNRNPDPTIPENLDALAAAVAEQGADIGIAFDGDGDRVAVVSASGRRPRADQLLMVLADDMVSRNPGCEVLFDVKCSRLLGQLVLDRGGRPVMWKCGHSHMKRKIASSDALLAGEFSGHIFFKERWYGFDDGLYAAARLLEALTLAGTTLDEELVSYPKLFSSPEILLPVDDERKFDVVNAFAQQNDFRDAKLIDIDGLRYEFRNGWGLLRASNTGPAITLRFEAESEAALDGIRESFAQTLAKIDPNLADSL
ncbi:phosphomannomutase/phosphoglucomutase [Spongiibacter tropicus]|uniref:phosphomannomutase/phosphoglucomutase n=1 Tax=Spongiibacter tropicus TaxID=454602 RepID=UPI0003B50E74|nr:phosphomannomutase/phosphoglucomutase [Spongiibacter tropicus]